MNGANPYDAGQLSREAGEELKQHYAYSPMSIWLFTPFTKIRYQAAYNFYLGLKIAVLAFLIFFWRKYFFKGGTDILFYLLLLFGFSGAIYLDFRAGNISVFEQAVIWLSFYFLLKDKYLYFCGLIVLISLFKLTPVLLLALLPILGKNCRWKALVWSVSAFLGLLLLNFILWPGLFASWIRSSVMIAEGGSINPTTLSMLQELSKILFFSHESHNSMPAALIASGIISLIVIAVTWNLAQKMKNSLDIDYKAAIIFLICVVYAIIVPRFKDYSYILILPPSYFIIRHSAKTYFAFVIVLILSRDLYFESGVPIANFFWKYYNVFLLYLIWGLFIAVFRRKSGTGTLNQLPVETLL